jgi:mono/diheme cytochrome c family protein
MVAKWTVAQALVGAFFVAAALSPFAQIVRAQPQRQPSVERGKEIAERACSGCHVIDSEKGATTFQGTEVPSFRAIAALPDRTAGRLETFVMVPHRSMPAIPLELSEVRDVVAYVLSLK